MLGICVYLGIVIDLRIMDCLYIQVEQTLFQKNKNYHRNNVKKKRVGVAQWLTCMSRYQSVAGSNPIKGSHFYLKQKLLHS